MNRPSIRRGVLCVTAMAFALALFAIRAGAQDDAGFRPEDYYELIRLDDVAVSPAGDLVAFTVVRTAEEENRRRREIWVRTLRDGEPRGEAFRLTAPAEDSHSPRWSPDGSLLSFVSDRAGDPNPIWFVRVGGVGGEAFHVEGVEGPPVWSPDGEWIAYLKAPEGGEGARRRMAPDAITSTLDSTRFRGRVITHLPYTDEGDSGFVPHPAVAPRKQLFVVPADGGEPRQITSMDVEITDPSWAENGDRVYFAAGRFLERPFERGSSAALWRVTREGGELQRITGAIGYQHAPAVSPDGGRIAYLDARRPGTHAEVRVLDLDGNGLPETQPVTVTGDFEGDPEAPRWSRDGETLYFAARDQGGRHLYRWAAGGPVEPVTAGPRRLESFSFSADGSVLAYVATDAATPPEVYVSRGDGTVEEPATAFNERLDGRSLSPAERLTWISSDSTEIEGWVIPPTSVRLEGGHPVVLALRDHRYGASGHDFRPLHQILAEAGFYVFYANPRGSAGYGEAFQRAVRERWGMVEKEDLVSGVEAVLARYPQASRERIGVVGHGYGGFLASWLTATSDRFAASVASAPAVNWESWFGTSAARSLVERDLGTLPWRRRSVYRRLSPLSYVENVTAPTLVLLGEEDRIFPPSEAEQWYTALRRRDVPTEMVRYPGALHDLPRSGEPWQVADRLERIRSWFRDWLVEQPLESRVSEVAR